MAMKLQWLPEPSSRGGWRGGSDYNSEHSDQMIYYGFDRFGTVLAMVTYHEHHYMPSKWRISNAPYIADEPYEVADAKASRSSKREAMLLAESFIDEDESTS